MLGRFGLRKQGLWTITVSTLLLPLLLLSLFWAFDSRGENATFLASVALLVVFVWALLSWRVKTGNLFDPYALFLIAAALFNGGTAFLEILGLNEKDVLYSKISPQITLFSPQITLETLLLITLGLALFHLGGLLSVSAYSRERLRANATAKRTLPTLQALRLVGWVLLAVSLIPAFLGLKEAVTLSISSGYMSVLTQSAASRGFDAAPARLASFIVPGILFLLAGSKGSRFNVVLSMIVTLGYSSTLFVLGVRQGAVMLIIAYAWVYHRTIRPLPKGLLLGGGSLLLFVILPLVKAFRNVAGGSRLSLESLWNTYFSIDNPAIAIISEMGYSATTVAHTISRVPDFRDFDMGASYFYALFSVVPNLFWDVHPSLAHGELNQWLIQTVDPSRSNLGEFSFGFSFIAEAYLNFGWLGAPLALAIMGFLLGSLVLWADKSTDPARIAMVGAFMAFFLLFARQESNTIFRPFLWYSLAPYLCVYGLRLLLRPKFSVTSRRFKVRETSQMHPLKYQGDEIG